MGRAEEGALKAMLEIVGGLRLEVAAMERDLDSLWSRACPQCMNPLSKPEAEEPWKCTKCGWTE